MALHLAKFTGVQTALLGQHIDRNAHRADVMQKSRAVQQRELVVGQLEGGAKLHCPMGDFLRKAGAGAVAILHGARQRDDDALELIELAVWPARSEADTTPPPKPGAVRWGVFSIKP